MRDTETLSLVGTSVDEQGKTHSVGIQLVLADTTWEKFETSNYFFKTKSGVYSRAVNVVTLFQKDGATRVGQLHPLVPETAKPGDKGQGHSFEKAIDFSWEVK